MDLLFLSKFQIHKMCRKSAISHWPTQSIPVDRKTFCVVLDVLRCEPSSSFMLGFCLMLQCTAHCTCVYTGIVDESPPCGTMCRFVALSLFLLYLFMLEITKPHSNHANMLMTFVSVPIFFRHLKLPEHAQWLNGSCAHVIMRVCASVCVYFMLPADFMRYTFCLIFTSANDNSKQTAKHVCKHACALLALACTSELCHIYFDCICLRISFVCLFFTKARDTS